MEEGRTFTPRNNQKNYSLKNPNKKLFLILKDSMVPFLANTPAKGSYKVHLKKPSPKVRERRAEQGHLDELFLPLL